MENTSCGVSKKVNSGNISFDMKRLKFNIEYEEGLSAPYIDWVGGGNFDGYIIRKYLLFYENDNQVKLTTKIINQSNYGNDLIDSFIIGKFHYSDKETITIEFENFQMRGKILGRQDEFIAFSIWDTQHLNKNEVYELIEK